MASDDDMADESSSERGRLLRGAFEQFADSPFRGDVMVERVSLTYPHDVFAESLMAAGILGAVAVFAVLGLGVSASIRLLRTRPDAAWVALVAIQVAVGAMFLGSLYTSDSLWFFLSAATATACATSDATTLPRQCWRPEPGLVG